jgi:Cu/Zn superoxide dismutase
MKQKQMEHDTRRTEVAATKRQSERMQHEHEHELAMQRDHHLGDLAGLESLHNKLSRVRRIGLPM